MMMLSGMVMNVVKKFHINLTTIILMFDLELDKFGVDVQVLKDPVDL